MQIPLTPANEKERLAALKNFNIIDTLPEDIYDHYAVLASQICGTPIALIALIDETRIWFKSKVGMDVSETPRETSLCAHTLLQDDLFEIKDALSDARFADNPLVIGAPNTRFYAGMPIATPEGYNLGTICVIDSQPRVLTEQQRDALKRIAKLIMSQLEQQSTKKTILQLNETLNENAKFRQTLIDSVPALIGYWSNEEKCVYANKHYQTYYGIDSQSIIGKYYLDIIPEYMTAQTYPYLKKALQGEKQSVQVTRNRTGTTDYGLGYFTPHFDDEQNVLGVFILGFDITDIKNTEAKLHLSEKALESTHEGILITDANHQFIYTNAGFTNITGYSAEEALGKRPNLLKSGQHDEAFYVSLNKAVKDLGYWHGTLINRHKSGTLYSVLMTVDSIKDEAGMVTNYVASMIDITTTEKTKADLALSSNMLRRAGKLANVAGWEVDLQTQEFSCSDQMYEMLEVEDTQAFNTQVGIMAVQPEAREAMLKAAEACLKDGTPWDLEVPCTTAKGKHIWIRSIGERVELNGVPIKIAGAGQDITARKIQELENQAREVSLRNALIREVHHHIKNSIQGISGLLFNVTEQNPLMSEPINHAISKLNSIAVIHGLQGKNVDTIIDLSELALAISQDIESVWQTHIHFVKTNNWTQCYLEKNEAVPIALILNELITNAIKHGEKGGNVRVNLSQINHNANENEVQITIANSGEFRTTPNEEPSSINQAGLKLVKSLMPRVGADLTFQNENNQAQVTLILQSPVINFS